MDACPLFLDRARADAVRRTPYAVRHNVSVDYIAGDMRSLPWTRRFDRIVNWFTAFGYFDDAGNRQVLTQVARALAPGGRAVFDLMNRDLLARVLMAPDHVSAERDGDLVLDRSRLDPLNSRVITERTVPRGGQVRRIPFFVRLFTFTELRDWLVTAGFSDVKGYGEDGAALSPGSRRLVVTACLGEVRGLQSGQPLGNTA